MAIYCHIKAMCGHVWWPYMVGGPRVSWSPPGCYGSQGFVVPPPRCYGSQGSAYPLPPMPWVLIGIFGLPLMLWNQPFSGDCCTFCRRLLTLTRKGGSVAMTTCAHPRPPQPQGGDPSGGVVGATDRYRGARPPTIYVSGPRDQAPQG